MESLHALGNRSPEALSSKKMWLCYWVLFVGCSWVYHYFEWLLSIPFYVLSFYVDIYFEAQLILAAALVLPKFLLVKKVHKTIETQGGPILMQVAELVSAQTKELATKAKQAFDKMNK